MHRLMVTLLTVFVLLVAASVAGVDGAALADDRLSAKTYKVFSFIDFSKLIHFLESIQRLRRPLLCSRLT